MRKKIEKMNKRVKTRVIIKRRPKPKTNPDMGKEGTRQMRTKRMEVGAYT